MSHEKTTRTLHRVVLSFSPTRSVVHIYLFPSPFDIDVYLRTAPAARFAWIVQLSGTSCASRFLLTRRGGWRPDKTTAVRRSCNWRCPSGPPARPDSR